MTQYLVCYDITSDHLRVKLSKFLLRAGGKRLQYSVFVVPMESHSAWKSAQRDWRTLMEQHPEAQPSDQLLGIKITPTALKQAYVYPSDHLLALPTDASIVV